MESLIHHGRNIKRLREMIGMKQEVLAFELGANWSQKKISLLEQKKEVGEETIQEVAKALDVPSGMIYQFSEEFVRYLFCQTTNQPK
nr:transcriptional regulator [Algoriphagus sp.]